MSAWLGSKCSSVYRPRTKTDIRPMTITISEDEPSDLRPWSNSVGIVTLVLRASTCERTGSVLRYASPARARTGPLKRYLSRSAWYTAGSSPARFLEERKRPTSVTTRATARNVNKRNGIGASFYLLLATSTNDTDSIAHSF